MLEQADTGLHYITVSSAENHLLLASAKDISKCWSFVVILGPSFGHTWMDGTLMGVISADVFTHYFRGHIRHRGLITLLNWFPSKDHIDGTGIHQPGDAPLLAH